MKAFRLCLWFSVAVALPGSALAQVDYSAGKSGPQLFSSDCSACHQSPGGLAKGRDAYTLSSFLREHYTTGGTSAGVLANYLAGVGGRQPPARGSQAPGATATAPAAGTPKPPAALEGGRPKPGDARKTKPTTTEAEREPAKPTIDVLQGKVRSYATSGEQAVPVAIAPAAVAPAETAAPPPSSIPLRGGVAAEEPSGRAPEVKSVPQTESGASPSSATPAQPAPESPSTRPPG
jgi:hypothetical protein